ncbi:MAG: metallophosphoesterase family protein, partial [Candidatus Omnitrophica bacterium]|nr:metallophosphoesterase family protein [Candidatus Omnitrophota bacterium]
MRILVLSDTHIPRAAHALPDIIIDEIQKSDMVLHAGD